MLNVNFGIIQKKVYKQVKMPNRSGDKIMAKASTTQTAQKSVQFCHTTNLFGNSPIFLVEWQKSDKFWLFV
jgi:hypothetical protein